VNENLIVCGDSHGRLFVWNVKDEEDQIEVSSEEESNVQNPALVCSLEQAWNSISPSPAGIMDQLYTDSNSRLRITASVYLPSQGNLICGREDGSIVIIPAAQTIMLQMLIGKHQTYENWPAHQVLKGHTGKVNCLLYPHHQNSRYELSHLLSGGVDFSVCLWDLDAGCLLYRYSVHAGEVNQLLVPPPNCNARVLNSICSVASDHSVALLSIKERKCIMLASRHLFPVTTIKWRPLDDFIIVACGDGSLYVWQMETGLLDRVVHGMLAEEILDACDQNTVVHDVSINPALHVFRSIKFGNFDAIRSAAAKGIQQLTQTNQEKKEVIDLTVQSRSNPLMIQPIKTNPKDADSHVLLFDIESLIVRLLTEEYATMSPGMLESSGLTNNTEYQKYLYLANSPDTQHKFSGLLSKLKDTAENAAQKLQKTDMAGIKNATEELLVGRKSSVSSDATKSDIDDRASKRSKSPDSNLTMDIAQILLSLLHGWGLDSELDRVCDSKLGLLRPLRPPCFGLLSKNNHLALLLPTFLHKSELTRSQLHSPLERNISASSSGVCSASTSNATFTVACPLGRVSSTSGKHVRLAKELIPSSLQIEEQRAQRFACKYHWELSNALSTSHLLCIISLVNTLMSMNSGTFVTQQDRKRKLYRRLSKSDAKTYDGQDLDADIRAFEAEAIVKQQEQVKQGWSLLATLHCVLLPDYVKSHALKRPLLESLAARWQDRCLEVREAAQALLLAELRRLGPKGRKQLVEEWAINLPKERASSQVAAHQQYQNYMAPSHMPQQGSSASLQSVGSGQVSLTGSVGGAGSGVVSTVGSMVDLENQQSGSRVDLHGEIQTEDESHSDQNDAEQRRLSNAAERRKKKRIAVILMGVIGSEYGQEMEQSKRRSNGSSSTAGSEERRKPIVEGFGAGNYSLSMQTSSALFQLLVVPPSVTDHSIRRAAVDLIGRGFTVWEPYLNVSQVLIRLLELCNDSEKLVASMSFGLPLTPEADSCRTARHALGQIATSRPPAYISTLACEIARYNSMQQNAQHVTTTLQSVLQRAKPEMLRNIDLLIKSMPNEIWDLMIETMDIILHCLDFKHLKEQSLGDVFPSIISRFPNVSYCSTSRRIAVGAKNGKMAIYDLKQPKSQVIVGHTQAVTCLAFSPDGKYLSSYSMYENKLMFWSTATSLLGWGNSQIKLLRTFNTPPVSENIVKSLVTSNTNVSATGQLNNVDSRIARLVWINSKVTILIYSDGSEYRYMI
jgi:WD40 repeat protein